ncbi:MAG TPA: hypothetical protein DHV60_07385, partial [Verrucomicrobiales bacterium]|nr:hypothetical protein [Verrucomicrobiales bacterium]
NETSLEQMLIDIAGLTDERGLKIAVRGMKLIIPKELQFIAERVINSNLRSGILECGKGVSLCSRASPVIECRTI